MRILNWVGRKKAGHMNYVMYGNLRTPVFMNCFFLFLFLSLWLFAPSIFHIPLVQSLKKIFFVFLIVWLSLRVVKIIATLSKRRFDVTHEDNLRARAVHTQISVLQRIASFLVVLLGFASFFLLFDQLRGLGVSLLASAGVAGIVLGLAAQKTLGNLLAGIQIALTQPIRIDDVVIVENEWGWIEDITLTYVIVRIWDLRRLVVPISYFIDKPFQNWTRSSSDILGSVFLYTDYSMPIEPIREKVTQILDGHPKWDGKVNVVQVTDCKPDTQEIRILISARNSPHAWDLRCEVREKIIAFVQEEYPDALPKTRAQLQRNLRDSNNDNNDKTAQPA